MDDRQRRFILHEQLTAINKELGENGGNAQEIAAISNASCAAKMPADIEAHVRTELNRLKRMQDGSSEYSMLRTWIDTMTEMAWAPPAELPIDIAAARRTLEADPFGLDRVKRRIVEFLAVRKLNPHGRAPILFFVGPPGVGKNSLRQSVARDCAAVRACVFRSAACMTRPRSAATGAPMSGRFRAASCRACARAARVTA